MNAPSADAVVQLAHPIQDRALERIRLGTRAEVDRAYYDIELDLAELRQRVGASAFRKGLAGMREHPLFALLQDDPFIRHSFTRPRGYPGDAELLDYIYGAGDSAEKVAAASEFGQLSYASMRNCIACRAVRYRAARIAERVQRGLRTIAGLRVFSLAAGHLCELQTVRWTRTPDLVLAADQDPHSVAEIARRYAPENVDARLVSVKQAIQGDVGERDFHFVYAAGLYDYLPDDVATLLTRRLLDLVAPGGTLLVPNFAPDCTGAAFMEYGMDWHLVYRDEAALEAMVAAVTRPGEVEVALSRDPSDQIAFVELTRPF